MLKKIWLYLACAATLAAGTTILNNHIRSTSNTQMLKEILARQEQMMKQNQALILMATFRTDPWSGKMMSAFQDEWYDLIVQVMPDMRHSDMPSVEEIQRRYAADIVPDNILNQLEVYQ